MWYNDVELTTAASTLTKTTDSALSGSLYNSGDPIEIMSVWNAGKLY